MAETLAALLRHFAVTAHTLRAGAFTGFHSIDGTGSCGQMYLIRTGVVEVQHDGPALRIAQPTLLLYPRPAAHRLITDSADFVCAQIDFEGGATNPIAAALPSVIWLPLADVHGSEALLQLLFEEAAGQSGGREPMLDRLFEVVLLQALRQLMAVETKSNMLAGFTHSRLRHALRALHEQPEKDCSLDELASVSGMPANAFASTFREVLGITPANYQQHFRIYLAWYTQASAELDFFADEIEQFASNDRTLPLPDRPIVFVGSSSIRLWEKLERDMAPLPVLNRGFGGAHLSHVVHFLDNVVIRYQPRAVVLYAGDNDLDERTDKTTEDVVRDFRAFVSRVQTRVPDVRIYYVSIKPSRLRWCDWPRQRQANQQIAAICTSDPHLVYVDVATPMLSAGAPPSRDLFFDGLHLSAKGYALWRGIIKPCLEKDFGSLAP